MRKFSKLISLALAVVCASSVLVLASGCGGVKIDHTKTQLYVSNYDAGIGRTWITSIGAEFEEAFKDYSFQEGRTGVQIIYNHNRVTTGTTFEEKIVSMEDNVFFTEGVNYPSLVSNNRIYDVTDIMTSPAITGVDAGGNFTRESVTIESKIENEFLSYLDRDTSAENKKYYALPYYLSLKSIIFDAVLWDTNFYYLGSAPSDIVAMATLSGTGVEAAKAAYQAEIDKLNAGQSSDWLKFANEDGILKGTNEEIGLSAGPDGKFGTDDDGLPATYDEFYLLCAEINKRVTPLIYTGKYPGYADAITNGLFWLHEGADNIKTYYSLDGTIDDLAVLDDNGNLVYEGGKIKTESKTFSNSTINGSTRTGAYLDGYEAQRAVGKYYALQFAEKIGKSDWLHSDCTNSAISHIAAQGKFLTSVYSASSNEKNRIAMLVDGAWWQQESDQIFTTMSKDEQYSKMNRDIRLMQLPNATIDRYAEKSASDEKNVAVAQNDSFCVINGNLDANSPQLAVAKAFVSFVNNDEMLNKFSEITNMYRGLNYQINAETETKMSKYGKELIEFVEETEIVYPYTNNDIVLKNYGYLKNNTTAWNWHTMAQIGGKSLEVTYPIASFEANSTFTALDYFNGLLNYHKNTVWPKLI